MRILIIIGVIYVCLAVGVSVYCAAKEDVEGHRFAKFLLRFIWFFGFFAPPQQLRK